jgi:RHS repeat-associated protein
MTTDANGVPTATMLYGAWGGTRYSTGALNTKYEYTGQRNEAGIGLHFYGARWYDDYLGRMAQADTIVPGGVQGMDRYAYTFNNPLKYTDPSGHDPWWNDPLFYLGIYVTGGIYQQNADVCYDCTGHPRWAVGPAVFLGIVDDPKYASIGPAKITDEQMGTPYGTEVIDGSGHSRGYGLGLRSPGASAPNQEDIGVAEAGMGRRIALGLKICEEVNCSSTDKVMVAALSADGLFDTSNFKTASRQKFYLNPNGTFDWDGYINNYYNPDPQDHIRTKTIPHFIKKIKSDISDVNWDYIEGLTE